MNRRVFTRKNLSHKIWHFSDYIRGCPNIADMKKSILFIVITCVVVFHSPDMQAQYVVGNPQWKWDTIILYGEQDELAGRYLQWCDVNGNVLEQLIQKRELNSWVNKARITMAYELGRIVSSTTAAWNGSAWYDMVRITPGYDGLGRITSELIEQNKLNGWSNYKLRHYAYGAQNRKEQVMQERWYSGNWLYDTKTDYDYDDNGFYDTITYQYSETGEGWINGMRLIYTCDQAGNWLEALAESWETGSWEGLNKIIYQCDARGNIENETYATKVGNAWVNEFRRVYTYDANDNALTGKNEIYTGIQWLPEVTSSYIYYKKDYLVMLEDDHYRFEASYSNYPLGMPERPAPLVSFYPNPADGFFRITGTGESFTPAEIVIFNENGSPVLHTYSSSGEVNTRQLVNGLYIIKVGNKPGYSGKLLIRHP